MIGGGDCDFDKRTDLNLTIFSSTRTLHSQIPHKLIFIRVEDARLLYVANTCKSAVPPRPSLVAPFYNTDILLLSIYLTPYISLHLIQCTWLASNLRHNDLGRSYSFDIEESGHQFLVEFDGIMTEMRLLDSFAPEWWEFTHPGSSLSSSIRLVLPLSPPIPFKSVPYPASRRDRFSIPN